jgi:hypothetical protein
MVDRPAHGKIYITTSLQLSHCNNRTDSSSAISPLSFALLLRLWNANEQSQTLET